MFKKIIKSKKLKIAIIVIIFIPLILEIIMMLDTINVVSDIKKVAKGEIEYVGPYDPKSPNCRNNFNYIKETTQADRPYIKGFRREFTYHNLNEGYILVTYDLGYYDKDNNLKNVDRQTLKYDIKREGLKFKATKVMGYNY